MRVDAWYSVAVLLALLVLVMPCFRQPGEYHGSEIYSLALDYPRLANHSVRVEGELVGGGGTIILEGRLAGAGRGYLIIESAGKEYRVGGPLAGREDVAAKKIWVKPG